LGPVEAESSLVLKIGYIIHAAGEISAEINLTLLDYIFTHFDQQFISNNSLPLQPPQISFTQSPADPWATIQALYGEFSLLFLFLNR
jgi:hypothetical protein